MKVFQVSFKAQPKNYKKIDESVSRSAQPDKEDFKWLNQQGVTDVINFRTMVVSGLSFDEEKAVKKEGMVYHNIPSITSKPTEENVAKFLDIVEGVKENGGKVHIHCKAGVDRTGMYSFIYKTKNNIDSFKNNVNEMMEMGHHNHMYPNLLDWTANYVQRFKE